MKKSQNSQRVAGNTEHQLNFFRGIFATKARQYKAPGKDVR
jgi:hypothetical protein